MKYLLFIIVASSSVTAHANKSNVGTSNGRFQIIQLSDMRRDQYMIDTQTGKTWTRICSVSNGPDCELGAWFPEETVGITISEADYYKRARELKKFIEEQKSQKSGAGQ